MVIFLSCVKSKAAKPCAAKDMYTSALFKKSYEYAETLGGKIYILSAKHGLLRPEKIIEPYNLTLNTMNEADRRRWAYKVCKQCESEGISYNDKVVFLCGENYRKYLALKFKNSVIPIKGLGLGRQLQFYNKKLGVK